MQENMKEKKNGNRQVSIPRKQQVTRQGSMKEKQ